MGQGASQPEPEELLDDVVQPQLELQHNQDQSHNDAEDEKQQQEEEEGEVANSEQQQPAASSTGSWLTRWLTPFTGSKKKRRRDEDEQEHEDAVNQAHPQPAPSSAARDPQPHQHKHIKLSASSSSSSSSFSSPAVASSSHSSPSHSCNDCDSLRAQVADLQQQLSHTRSLSSDLTCAVCHFLFLSPVTTECGHSWCLHCLVKSLQSKRQCPLCRSAITQRPMTAALLLTSQLTTAVSQLPPAEREERTKEQDRRSHERIDYDTELTRLVPPAAGQRRLARQPVYDDGDGVFRCPWCRLEVQFADSCCGDQCGPIDWSEEMEDGGGEGAWQANSIDLDEMEEEDEMDEDDELDYFEEMDEWAAQRRAARVRAANEDGEEGELDEDGNEVTEPYWNDDGSFSCMTCGAAMEYAQEYCCHGRVDWTEVYRAQAEAYDMGYDEDDMEAEEAEEAEEVEEEEEVEELGADEEVGDPYDFAAVHGLRRTDEEFQEEEEVDDDGFDEAEDEDAGELEWVDAADDMDDHLTDTMRLRRQIFAEAGVDTDDEEVRELMQQARHIRRRNPRPAPVRSEYERIRARLIRASNRAGQRSALADDIAAGEVERELAEQLAADEQEEAADQAAELAELQAALEARHRSLHRNRRNHRPPPPASDYDAIRARLIRANNRRAQLEALAEDLAEVEEGIEEALAADEAANEEADVAELQAAVDGGDGGGGEVDDEGEVELDFVTGNGQRIVRSNSSQAVGEDEADDAEEVADETEELEGMYWSGDDAGEVADAADDDDDGEVEYVPSAA